MGLRSSLTLEFYKKAYEHIIEHYPFWNRTSGRDHIWVLFIKGFSYLPVWRMLEKECYISFAIYSFCCVYANDGTFTSEGSFFHGMKALAMPLGRYGTA